jgi:large subunit ribosomal protein L30
VKQEKVLIKQIRSVIGRDRRAKATLQALGLGRVGKQRVVAVNPAAAGMIRAVVHLVEVQKVD